jgi:ribulose-phosphate 3-epimerase
MAIVVPAILEDDWDNFRSKLETIIKIPGVKRIQVDFSDGQFTSHKDLQISELDILNPAFEWEAHLMVNDPRAYFFEAKLVGFKTVLFHFEAIKDKNEISQLAEELDALKLTPGLVINPETSITEVLPYLDFFKQISIMGIHPGEKGQKELPNIDEKVRELRNAYKNGILEVDGGVKISNIKELSAAGADLLIANSALFDTGSEGNKTPADNFQELSHAIL